MTHPKLLNETFQLIKKLSPMIPPQKLDDFEKEHGLGRFDVMFKQKEGKKTIWGDEEMDFNSVTLREITNNIYDCLYDNYEVWIRETPEIVDGPTVIRDEWIKYAISLEADNLEEDDAILSCRMISGWLVISAVYDATLKQKFHFYSDMGFLDRIVAGPTENEQFMLMEDELWDLVYQKIRKFSIKLAPDGAFCTHCENRLDDISSKLKEFHAADLDEMWDFTQKAKKYFETLKDHLTKKEFTEKMSLIENQLSEIKKQLDIEVKLENEYENLMESRPRPYVCNICEKILCEELIIDKRVCLECRNNIFEEIAKKMNYDLDL